MTEEEASVAYFNAVGLLNDIIESGVRGSRDDILDELDNDLDLVD